MSWETTEFTINNIKNLDQLQYDIEVESNLIYSSKQARKNRTMEEIINQTKQGKIAEQFLIETKEFIRCKLKYHDLVDGYGDINEVKAFSVFDKSAPGVKQCLTELRNTSWNQSKYLLLFRYDNGVYKFLERIPIFKNKLTPLEFVKSRGLDHISIKMAANLIDDYNNYLKI